MQINPPLIQEVTEMNRRQFCLQAGAIASGFSLANLGCKHVTNRRLGPTNLLEHWEVSGSAYECGYQSGRHFRKNIQTAFNRRRAWFEPIRRYMQADLDGRCHAFLKSAQQHYPETVEELKGWSDGSEVPFLDLVALNLKAELQAMMKQAQPECPGCSTIALVTPDQMHLVHNEDGDRAYADLMFLLTIKQPHKPTITSLTYPGILPGNGPALNSAGLVLTTNYIASSSCDPVLGDTS